ncbi:hypothetical protein PZA11_005427 [Diplocarpon coronariae]
MKSSLLTPPKLLSSAESERLALRKIRAKQRALTKSRPRSPPPRRPWISIFQIQRLVNEACAQTLTEANQGLEEGVKGELREEWWMIVDDCVNVFWERLRCFDCGGICGAETWGEGQGVDGLERYLEVLRAEMDISEPWELQEDKVDRWDMLLWNIEKTIAASRRERCVFAADAAARAEVERLRIEETRRKEAAMEQARREKVARDQRLSEKDEELQRFAAVGSPVQLYGDWRYEMKGYGEDIDDIGDEEMMKGLKIRKGEGRGRERDRAEVDVLSTIDELDEDGPFVRGEGKWPRGSVKSMQRLSTVDESDRDVDEEALIHMPRRVDSDAASTNGVLQPFMIDELDGLDDSDQDEAIEINTIPRQEPHSTTPDLVEPIAADSKPSSSIDEALYADDDMKSAIIQDIHKDSEFFVTDASSQTQSLIRDTMMQEEDTRSLFCDEDEDMKDDKPKEMVGFLFDGDRDDDMEGGYVHYIMSGDVRELGVMMGGESDESEEL